MPDTKKRYREEMLDHFAQIEKEEHQRISNTLQEQLFQSDLWKNADTIGIYLSVRDEWDTRKIVEKAWADGKRVAIPKTVSKTKEMFFYAITDWSQVIEGPFQLEEPDTEKTTLVEKDEIQLMVVPGLVFTREGYRIGFGGGFYDRYLSDFIHTTVSLIHTDQLKDSFPIESFDIPVNYLITEQGIIG